MLALSAETLVLMKAAVNKEQRRRHIATEYRRHFGDAPTIWVQAPGRVDLMGSHTDYNDGFVLTQAIDRSTWIAARPRSDRRVDIRSLNAEGGAHFSLDDNEFDEEVPWTNYVRGVADILRQQGHELRGFDGLIHSTVPFGSGLSSSAALEVATAVLFDYLSHLKIDKVRLALICQRAENEFVGMNCGILDQYSSLMGETGSVILLDCRNLSSEAIPIASGIEVVICDTKSKRALTGTEYPERRKQCETGARLLSTYYPDVKALRDVSLEQLEAHRSELSEVVARRCHYVIEENQRVLDMARALGEGDLHQLGALAEDSFVGARDLYEISSREMEWMMEAMITGPGVIGARQAGAGFGGCMVAMVEEGEVDGFARHVIEHYRSSSGIEAAVYPVQAARGAGIIDF